MIIRKGGIVALVFTLAVSGCAMDNMTGTQKALLAGTAAAAIGGIAYGVHQKHEAEKQKYKNEDHDKDDRYSHHAYRDDRDQCYDYYGHWQC